MNADEFDVIGCGPSRETIIKRPDNWRDLIPAVKFSVGDSVEGMDFEGVDIIEKAISDYCPLSQTALQWIQLVQDRSQQYNAARMWPAGDTQQRQLVIARCTGKSRSNPDQAASSPNSAQSRSQPPQP